MSDEEKHRFNGAHEAPSSIIERISHATDKHAVLLKEHTQILQDHSSTLKEIRAHLYKLDDIAANTGKLATSVDSALSRVFSMLEKREEGSRRASILVTGTMGLLLIIMSLAITKYELSAGSDNIAIGQHGHKESSNQ